MNWEPKGLLRRWRKNAVSGEGQVGSYDEYRDKALECSTAAQTVSDPHERVVLLEIAQRWLRLAKHVADSSPGTATANDDTPPEKS